MSNETPDAKAVFFQALEQPGQEDLIAYLDQACGEDRDLRARVEDLLRAHQKAGKFLGGSFQAGETAALTMDALGTQVGPYKLLQQLGEGGMGTVYLAERQRPMKQRVALKIIKRGMDSKKFIARFEAERQALAMMDHPNIAKVLDAGCTDNGRPYFVMELVKGVPLSEFCDENRLTTRERLQLFIQVCQAVHHAHQKGVIHRDIKPSNVLVALYDQKPVPKVIDFGVAKATNQQLTEKTLFTEVGSILGTWEYMSPEQAVLNQLDVDTRTDVYSLGVLLYELLTGETPLDRQRLRSAQLMETLRMIREEEPPKPSTRISSLGERATATAAYRKVKPEALVSEIRGDLDWIVMKSLEKERGRRYDSASRLSDDLQHFLNNELVEARPPSLWYQLHKLWQRNKMATFSTVAVSIALVIGLTLAVWGLQKQAAMSQELAAILQDLRSKNEKLKVALINQAITAAIANDERTMSEALDNAELVEADPVWRSIIHGLMADYQGDHEKAIGMLEEAVAVAPKNLAARAILASAYWNVGRIDEHEDCVLGLRNLRQATDFDTMFVAHANRFWDSAGAFDQISTLVKNRTSWGIAQVMLAEVQVWHAWDRRDIDEADSAIIHVQQAKSKLPPMAIIHQTELLACLAALDLASDNDTRRPAWQSRAEAAARELETTYSSRGRYYELATYYYQRGDKEKALGLLWDSGDFVQVSLREAILFGLRRFPEMNSTWAVMETGTPAEAIASVRTANASNLPFIRQIWAQLPLYACGEQQEAVEHWDKMLAKCGNGCLWNHEYPLMLFSGRWDEQDLVERATSENSRLREFFAYVCLGHYYLYREPNRESARRCFARAVEIGPIASEARVWAQSFVDLLNDEAWPEWLQQP